MGLIDNIEFNAKLRNHYVGKENIYRLGFVWHYRFNHGKSLGSTEWFGKPFMLPQGMSRNEGFKVLSYLTDFIEKEESYEPCSFQSVIALENILDLEQLGFRRVKDNDMMIKVIDLFTVYGRKLYFKLSPYYHKYFEWYTENVTLEEVKNIYAKYGIEFKDIVWNDKKNEIKQAKVLKHDNKINRP